MTFCLLHHTSHRLVFCFLLALGVAFSLFPSPSEAQRSAPRFAPPRPALASRGTNRLSLSILPHRVSNYRVSNYRAPNYRAPNYRAPNYRGARRVSSSLAPRAAQVARPRLVPVSAPNFNSLSNRGFEAARRSNFAPPIALGAYFYQDGQCAPGDNGAVRAWQSSAGRLPAVWMIFQGWTGWNQFPIAQAQRARQLGGKLLVTWEPWNTEAGGRDLSWNCNIIASGKHDAYIRQYARAVKSAGVPVMIRFAHEMNGDWYPWGTANKSSFARHNGNSPQSYVAMWRRVVSIFRAEGAYNAQWVWAPNIHYLNGNNSLPNQNADLAALYPGDGFVDWIGLSVYNDASRRNWRTFSDLFEGAYQTVTRISRKPLMIAEMGVTEVGAPRGTSKAAWISQTMLRDIPTRYPRVKLVNWFCRDKTNLGEADYRFDSSHASLQAFRFAVNSPLYGARLNGN